MKKRILSLIFVTLFIAYTVYLRVGDKIFLFLREDDNEGQVVPPASLNLPLNAPTTAPTLNSVPISQKYKNGEFTGSVADAYYGNIQVKAVISGGKITDVVFLQYPNDRRTSVEINTQAMPYLKAEAIQIQDAQVDTVSGASETSRAFRESLGAALALARN